MRKTAVIIVLALIPVGIADAQIPTEERDALIALYNATNGPGWTKKDNWLGAVDTECTWHGVTCSGGNVQKLELGSNQLYGPIPGAIGAFTSIEKLDLWGNQLAGSIPPEIGDLTSLLELWLTASDLSGSIPPELENLTELKWLALSLNQLTGSIPPEIGNLPNAMYVYLNGNQLTGSIPAELGNLPKVRHLFLVGNDLTGSIPAALGNLSTLWILRLGSNQLSGGIPPELGNLSSLKEMYLDRNPLGGGIPPEFGNLSNLTKLDLDWTELTEPIPPELGNMASLENLRLFHNQLRGPIPPELGNLSNLSYLGLGENRLSGQIPPELGNMSSLEALFLESNQLEGSIPSTLSNLSNLVALYLNSNRLSGQIPAKLGSLPLANLRLSSNRLSGEIPAELENLTGLTDDWGLRIRWNALHTDSASLITFLNAKQRDGDWQSTQTIAPVNLTHSRVGDHTLWLSWNAVTYIADPGGYEVFSSPTGSGVWTSGGWTEAKATTTYPVTGLDPGTTYDLAVVTYTDPHTDNLNLVDSDFSTLAVASTANTGCSPPEIDILGTGLGPFTLSLTDSFDSHTWSTAETTSSIVAGPPYGQWYWVTVTSAGPCEETAAVYLQPTIFTDDFENGHFAEWSSSVP